MEEKSCSQSYTVKTTHVLPPDTNALGTLFGGKLMAHIDDVAAIAATRHARKQVVTASTDSVDFLAPVKVGHFISVEAFVTWTHRTSMEVFVKVMTEDVESGNKTICTTAFLTFVALNEDGVPTAVPGVYPETDQEKTLHQGAAARAEYRNERRKEAKKMAKLLEGN